MVITVSHSDPFAEGWGDETSIINLDGRYPQPSYVRLGDTNPSALGIPEQSGRAGRSDSIKPWRIFSCTGLIGFRKNGGIEVTMDRDDNG